MRLAWEILCWFALGAGCFAMWWARRKIEYAAAVLGDATDAYQHATEVRQEVIKLLSDEASK